MAETLISALNFCRPGRETSLIEIFENLIRRVVSCFRQTKKSTITSQSQRGFQPWRCFWSIYYGNAKQHQRWLWHAVDHNTGEVLAYGLAHHQDEAFLELKTLLEPFGITQFYTDGWDAYERHINPVFHTVGKANTQTIERKHLTLRTRIERLARKTICFSRIGMVT